MSCVFPFVIAVDSGQVLILPFFILTISIATLALLTPVWGVRNRIRNAKLGALSEIEVDLRRSRDSLIGGDPHVQGHLADLLAYRSFMESVREWPFDNSTLARFLIYTLIPVGSWLGGALVERVLDAVLA